MWSGVGGDVMRQAWKRCCEAAVLLGCLILLVGYGKGGAKVVPLIGADIRVASFSGGRNDRPWNRNRQYGIYIMAVKVNKEEKAAVAEVVLTQNWVRTMIFSLYLFVRSFNPGISDWTGTLVCVMLNAA